MPVPQPSWGFFDVSGMFDTSEHEAACHAEATYLVEGIDLVIDVSEWVACEGITDLVFFDMPRRPASGAQSAAGL